jgi:hypothetical protein
LPDHIVNDQAEASVLDSFKRKIAGELELLNVERLQGPQARAASH